MRIDNEVLNVLSNAEVTGNTLKLMGQLDRSLYTRTNKVLEAAGGAWNRKAKVHIFGFEAADRVDQMLLTGEVDIPKDEFNYFPTPAAVVSRLLATAEIVPDMRVLEPSAGRGAIALACAKVGAIVDCYELMEENFNILASEDALHSVNKVDFLRIDPVAEYDRVIMNPPFAKQADIKHVMHAFKFLKNGGVLISVMSSGITFRDNRLTCEFRDMVSAHRGRIESLPDASFKSSGTSVSTVIVTIRN